MAKPLDEEDDRDDFEPVPRKTGFQRLHARHRFLAYVWAFAEFSRIVFAVCVFCLPSTVVLSFIIEVARHAFATWRTVFLAWQFYVCLLASWLVPYLLYKLAAFTAGFVLRILRVTDRPAL